MKTITVQPNQSLTDVVLMACGTMEGAMALMLANNISLTADAATGDVLNIPADAPTDAATLRYLAQNGIVIGTKPGH